jgi:hypothetical protein
MACQEHGIVSHMSADHTPIRDSIGSNAACQINALRLGLLSAHFSCLELPEMACISPVRRLRRNPVDDAEAQLAGDVQ